MKDDTSLPADKVAEVHPALAEAIRHTRERIAAAFTPERKYRARRRAHPQQKGEQ